MAETAQAPPPEAQLFQLIFGFMATRTLSAVAELKVADALKNGPRYYTDLAAAVGADQRALHRAMRLLVSIGVFAEPSAGTFALTPVSNLLRSDVPGSMRTMAEMITSESHWLPWGRFTDTLRSGRSGPIHAFGTDIFSWFQRAENAMQWQLFNSAMSGFSATTGAAIADAYDFSGFTRIVDIGGGHGQLLRTVLAKAPKASGVIFDLPDVVKGVTDTLGGRIECVGGSFFESVPAGADCYLMKHIIHDWSDEHCTKLLANVVKAMRPDGKVLVCEMVMPDTPEPHPAKFQDLNMLAMTEGGCERSEPELAALFKTAGLRLAAVHPTKSPVSVVEAVKA
jgi:hypothetical protein